MSQVVSSWQPVRKSLGECENRGNFGSRSASFCEADLPKNFRETEKEETPKSDGESEDVSTQETIETKETEIENATGVSEEDTSSFEKQSTKSVEQSNSEEPTKEPKTTPENSIEKSDADKSGDEGSTSPEKEIQSESKPEKSQNECGKGPGLLIPEEVIERPRKHKEGKSPRRSIGESGRNRKRKGRKDRKKHLVPENGADSAPTSPHSVEKSIGREPALRDSIRKKKYRPTSQHFKHCRLLRCVKATEEFNGTTDGELTGIRIGDVITLRGEPSAGWCEGECNGKTGWFPITIANELANEHKVKLSVEISLDSDEKLLETEKSGVDDSSVISNKKRISVLMERKIIKRPTHSELMGRNILTSSDNTRSEQLLKNIEQQKKAAVLTNLLAGRRPEPKFAPPESPRTISFEPSEDEESSRKYSITDEEISCTEISEEDETIEEKAVELFKTKPNKAITILVDNGIISNTPEAIADFLYCNPRLSGKMVGEYLGENDELNLKVLDAFIDKMNLTDTEFDQAMRTFLFVFYLPGEAQKIDRIMCAFAKKYFMQNSGESRTHGKIFKHQDSVYLLAFATIMLNTDLHSKNVKTKMTQDQFVHRTNDGTFPDVFLKDLYQRIAEEEIRTKDDKYTNAAKRGYLYVEKKTGIRGRKKQYQYWFVLDPDSTTLYAFKEKDEQKLMEEFDLSSLFIKKKQTPTADKNRRYPLQFVYRKQKPPELRLLARSQRLWVDWLTIFTEHLKPC